MCFWFLPPQGRLPDSGKTLTPHAHPRAAEVVWQPSVANRFLLQLLLQRSLAVHIPRQIRTLQFCPHMWVGCGDFSVLLTWLHSFSTVATAKVNHVPVDS